MFLSCSSKTSFLSQKLVNTAFLSRKFINTAYLSRKFINTCLSIDFKDLLDPSIAPQIVPRCCHIYGNILKPAKVRIFYSSVAFNLITNREGSRRALLVYFRLFLLRHRDTLPSRPVSQHMRTFVAEITTTCVHSGR